MALAMILARMSSDVIDDIGDVTGDGFAFQS